MKKREPGAILCGSSVPMPEGVKPPKGMDVRINVETEGMEEAREEIEMLAEAYARSTFTRRRSKTREERRNDNRYNNTNHDHSNNRLGGYCIRGKL